MARNTRPRKKTKKKSNAYKPLNKAGTRFHPPKEWYFQKVLMAELENLGWKVYNTSENRARAGMSPGIPDVIAFNTLTGTLLFFEVKRPTAVGPDKEELWTHPPEHYMSAEQKEFRDHVATVKQVHHVVGAREALMSYLGVRDESASTERKPKVTRRSAKGSSK